jgi:hypothetical protein
MMSTDPNVIEAAKWAGFFRARGFCPLPGDPNPEDGRKKPLCRFKDYFEGPAPSDLFDQFPSSNLQVITGRYWRLLVIDLDGQAGQDWFFGLGKPIPKTWAVRSGGGHGLHLWFRIPATYPHELRKAFLWNGENKHEGVERLCDRSLAMAPPSIHPTTGNRYQWANDGRFLPPTKLPMPADCPRWILDLPPIVKPRPEPAVIARGDGARLMPSSGGRYRIADVIDAIPDKIALVASWGVRFDGYRSPDGWWQCHAIDRPDSKASAAVHEASGFYTDQGSSARYRLFDLAVAMGQALDWRDAVASLGERYRSPQLERAS